MKIIDDEMTKETIPYYFRENTDINYDNVRKNRSLFSRVNYSIIESTLHSALNISFFSSVTLKHNDIFCMFFNITGATEKERRVLVLLVVIWKRMRE